MAVVRRDDQRRREAADELTALNQEMGLLAAERVSSADLEAVLEHARDEGNTEVEVVALDALARLAAEAHDPDAAQALLAASDRAAARMRHTLDDTDRVDAAHLRPATARERVTITDHGQPAAVLVNDQELADPAGLDPVVTG